MQIKHHKPATINHFSKVLNDLLEKGAYPIQEIIKQRGQMYKYLKKRPKRNGQCKEKRS